MKVICPGCQSELDPANTNCPVCLRPRSRKELLEGLKQTRRPPPKPWGRLLLALAAAAAAAYGGLAYLNRPTPAAPQAASAPAPAPDEAALAAAASQEPGAAPPTAARPATPSGTVLVKTAAAPPLASFERARARSRRRRVAPHPARPKGWEVHGQVYDLVSLRPVAAAKIVFQDKDSGRAFTAATDASGRYRIDLPKIDDGGYELTVEARRYSGVYLEEMSPPYRSQAKSRRLEALREASESAVLHVPLLPEESDSDVPYDLVLFQPE